MNQIRVAGRLRAVPIFPLEFVEPRKDIANVGARNPCGFRAPTFAMSFRCSTNSRGKTGTARSLCSYFATSRLIRVSKNKNNPVNRMSNVNYSCGDKF